MTRKKYDSDNYKEDRENPLYIGTERIDNNPEYFKATEEREVIGDYTGYENENRGEIE